MRQNKETEHGFDSIKTQRALDRFLPGLGVDLRLAIGLCVCFWVGTAAAAAKCADPFSTLQVQAISAFTQTRYFQGVSKPLVSQGLVKLSADRVQWHVKKPVDIVTVIAPDGVSQSIEGGPVQALGPRGGDSFLADSGLRHVLSGDFTAARAGYKITNLPEAPNGNWRLRLVPRAEPFARFVRHLDVEGCAGVAQIRVQQANGDWMDIHLTPADNAN